MITYTEKLPPSKSEPHRGFKFTKFDTDITDFSHTVGTLLFESPRKSCEFLLSEFPTGWAGRGFHLAKLPGAVGDDKEASSYDVFICNSGTGHQCDCKGFAYGKGKPCRHIQAVLDCIQNRWL